MDFGILLPHFGERASLSTIESAATLAETHRFDSVWARDSLLYRPLVIEDPSANFVDPFVSLTAAATATESLALGTGVIAPYRHPVLLARLCSSVGAAGDRELIAGVGLGGTEATYDLVDLPFDERPRLHRENVEILHRLVREGASSYDGTHYSFDDVTIAPQSTDRFGVWGGGSSPASLRRALEYCDGWLPGRINMPSLAAGIERIERECETAGVDRLSVGALPITSVASSREDALAAIDVEAILEEANERHVYWQRPEDSDRFTSARDLRGAVLAGTPAEILEDVRTFERIGLDHLVFDLRFQFSELERSIERLGEGVVSRV